MVKEKLQDINKQNSKIPLKLFVGNKANMFGEFFSKNTISLK